MFRGTSALGRRRGDCMQGVAKARFLDARELCRAMLGLGRFFAAAPAPSLQGAFVNAETPKQGFSRACADNIGGALKQLATLRALARIMKAAERVAHLRLNQLNACRCL
eukprot:2236214-Pyramimonas_sp.AAC.1